MSLENCKRDPEEGDGTTSWYKHKQHVLVFTYSGKPVFTRYGVEDNVTAITGTMAAICGKFSTMFSTPDRKNDTLRSISAGTYLFVFMEFGPLWLVCINNKSQSYEASKRVLEMCHLQILNILTSKVENALHVRPNFDVRPLMSGAESAVCNLISWFNAEVFSLTPGYEALPLSDTKRSVITTILKTAAPKQLMFAILLAQHRVVSLVVQKHIKLEANDIILLINFVTSSNSLKQNESWTPICLPCLNKEAFFCAYITYLNDETCLILATPTSDPKHFYTLKDHAERCNRALHNSGSLNDVHHSVKLCPFKLPVSVSTTLEVIHVAYLMCQSQQYFSSGFSREYDRKRKKYVYQLYHKCIDVLRGMTHPRQIEMETRHERVFVKQTKTYQMYCTVPRWISLNATNIEQLTKWIQMHESFIFFSVSNEMVL